MAKYRESNSLFMVASGVRDAFAGISWCGPVTHKCPKARTVGVASWCGMSENTYIYYLASVEPRSDSNNRVTVHVAFGGIPLPSRSET